MAFVSDAYFTSKNCYKETNYAESLEKEIIIFKMEKDLELLGKGAISLIANTKLNVSIVLNCFLYITIFRLNSTKTKTNFSPV